jgi:integrase
MTNYLTAPEMNGILRAAYKASRRDHLMLLLSFQHGLRNQEVAGIRLNDIQNGVLHVQREKNSLETNQPLITVDAPPAVAILRDEPAALAAWLQERPQGTDLLFPGYKGKPLSREQVNTISKKYGVPHHHCLKHALASQMFRAKQDSALVKQALGHRALSSTLVYLHVQDSEAMEAVKSALSQQ